MLPFWLVLIFSEYDDEEWDKLIPAGNHFVFPLLNHFTFADIFDKAKP